MTYELIHLPDGALAEPLDDELLEALADRLARREAGPRRTGEHGAPGHRTLTSRLSPQLYRALDREPPTGRSQLVAHVARMLEQQRPPAPAPAPDGDLDEHTLPRLAARAEAAWLGPPAAGLGTRPTGDRPLRDVLADQGLVADERQLGVLARLYGDSLSLTRWLLRGGGAARLDDLLAHAEHHCGVACRTPHAANDERASETLDADTRARIAATTGVEVGAVPVVRDPELARSGEAAGGTIRLRPDVGADPAGRHVVLHEAAHVVQSRLSGPVADRDLVEAEASEVAHAAERGAPAAPQLRADPDSAYGIDLPDLSPMALLRKVSPTAAQFVDEGLEGQLAKIGAAVDGALKGLLDGLGLGNFTAAFDGLVAAVKPGSLAFGVLTGCCECLDTALAKLLGALDGFLASEGATKVQKAIADGQKAEKDGVLDTLTDVFALLKKLGGPVLAVIEGAGNAIAWAKATLGAVADKVWTYICGKLGLDASLPPLDAIKKKLQELWDKAAQALAPLKNAITAAISWIKDSSPLAPLFKLAGDLQKLVAAVKKLVAAKATDARTWLATLAKELAGTVFEPLITALQTGRQALDAAATAVAAWFRGLLDKLGLLEAWSSAVSFLSSVVTTVKAFVAKVKAGLEAIGKKVEALFKEISEGAEKVYKAIKPLLDFVVGFAIAAMQTASGNLLAFPLFFLGNAWLHLLPDCYKDAILNFALDAFIKVVTWYPAAGMPLAAMMKAGVLGFLQKIRGMGRQKKIDAMDMVASFFAGNVEFTLGLIVGIFKGIYESTIGTVVFVFEIGAWLAEMGVQVTQFAGMSLTSILAGGGLAEFLAEAGESAPSEGAADQGGADQGTADQGGPGGAEQPDTGEGPEAEGEQTPADEPATDQEGDDEEGDDEADAEEEAPAELGEDDDPDDAPDEDDEPSDPGDEEPVLDGSDEEDGAEGPPSPEGTPPGGTTPGTPPPGGSTADADSEGETEAEGATETEGAADEADDDSLEPAPAMPADLLNGRALFDAIFKEGVTRADLEQLLASMSTGLEGAAKNAGGAAASALINELTKKGAAYDIGEKVGVVVGMVVAEVVIAYLTAGAGLAKTGVTLSKIGLKLAKNLPQLMKVLKTLTRVVKPLLAALQKLKKGIGAWAGKIAKYLDQLIEWAGKNIKKIVARIKKALKGKKGKKPKGKKPKGKGKGKKGKGKKGKGKKKKGKGKKKDKDKKDGSLKLAARRAAAMGWSKMGGLAGAVHSLGEVRSRLGGATVRRAKGITVKLSIAGKKSGWKVKAVASRKARRATARSGTGWITRAADKGRAKYYAYKSHAAKHKRLIDDAIKAIVATDEKSDQDKKNERQQYDAIKREAEEQKRTGQGKIELRGVHFKIDVESFQSAEKDDEVTTELVITPNASKGKVRRKINKANKYNATARPKSTSATYDVTGAWADVQKFHPYVGPSAVIDHPVNSHNGASLTALQNGPTGNYHLKSSPNPGGSWAANGWRTKIFTDLSVLKKTKNPTTGKNYTEAEGQAKLLADYQAAGYAHLTKWEALALTDYAIHGYEGHHMVPVNWNASLAHSASNIYFLKSGQHAPLTSYFAQTKSAVLTEVYQ